MDNNDSNIKSQQTGGLKLMTVFIAVLALHVVVIGGFTVYHLMSGGSSDTDLTSTDKNHKSLKNADGAMTADGTTSDGAAPDKTVATTSASSDTTATAPASTPDTTAPAVATAPTPAPVPAPAANPTPAPAPTPSPAPTVTATAPAAPAPIATTAKPTTTTPAPGIVNELTSSGPIAPELAPPAEPNLAPTTMTPTPAPAPAITTPAPTALAGPVHMPPVAESKPAREHEHEHDVTYTVKITDSYPKIAKAHHISVAELKEANHIKGSTLHTGQKLIIPSGKTVASRSSETNSLEAAPTAPVMNGAAVPMTTSLVSTSSSHSHIYTIVKGDTLTKIAHKFKTTPSAIMAENSITDPTKLTIGKKLKIPSAESRSARNNSTSPSQPSQVQAKQGAATGQLATFVP